MFWPGSDLRSEPFLLWDTKNDNEAFETGPDGVGDKNSRKKIYLCPNKIMTIQRAHISLNLCDRPVLKGSFAYECMIWDEAEWAYFENCLH